MTEPLPKVPVETIIEKIDKPKSSGIAIKIMVGLLILVILSEIGYLLYNNYFKPGVESLSGPTIEEITTDIPKTTETENTNPTPTPLSSRVNNVSEKTIEYSYRLFNNPDFYFDNASISFTLEAQIIGIMSDITNYDNITYPFGIALKHQNITKNFLFSTKELLTTKVTKSNNPESQLDIYDLKEGDKISLSVTTNLINNPNTEGKIFINILN